MFLYQIYENTVCIIGCRDLGCIVEVPEQINGYPVTQLAGYAFSQKRMSKENGTWSGSELEGTLSGEIPYLCGERLEEITLPPTLKKIGKYAFYNCGNLKKLCCTSTIEDIGTGIFTGCGRLSEIEIAIKDGHRSCLKEILSELKQKLIVEYKSSAGIAKLIFPEFYEESGENTPARITTSYVHGCGHRYRYCFQGTEFQFREYDALFPHVKAQESEYVVIQLVLGRLRYPLGLTSNAKEGYEEYITKHISLAAECLIDEHDQQGLMWLVLQYARGRESMDEIIEYANRRSDTESLSFLMDYRHRNFKTRIRKFEL